MLEYDEGLAQLQKDINGALKRGRLSPRDHMILSNMPWVIKLAARYARISQVPVMEIVDDGIIGLIHAVDKYNPEKGTFSNYATWWIRAKIEKGLNSNSRLVTIPKHLPHIIRKIHRYWLKNDEDPSIEWVMENASCSKATARLSLKYSHPRYLSLSSVEVVGTFDDKETDKLYREELIDSLSCEQPSIDSDESLMELVNHTCTRKQAKAISLVSGLSGEESMTYKAAGSLLGLSGERVRQLCRAGAHEMERKGALKGLTP